MEGEMLTSTHPMRNQDAMEPELQILPAFIFLLLYQEHERRRRRPRGASGGCVLASGAGGGSVLGSGAGGGGVLGSGAGGVGVLNSGAGGGGVLGSGAGGGVVLGSGAGGSGVHRADFPQTCRFYCGGLSVLWLLATLAALVLGALQKPVTTGTTGPADFVAEVLGRDLERQALGE
ncbi:hypothetical protein NDU88_004135 [Pleurodeles waltl]|uniref:Uncharacterized protein n=1 Tax=Pleurodeles waltl TaxID=8319 RepID=A0AAV7WXA8_PLEWA|nr:hypothetical protein NDU88_004135 [Pleurodeles waltl]